MKKIFSILFCPLAFFSYSQNIDSARSAIKQLCSEEFAGRGYVNDGDKKAAEFIADKFRKLNISSFSPNFFQQFGFPVIYFPEKTELNIDGVDLIPGKDFIVNPGCPYIKGNFKILKIDSATVDNKFLFEKLSNSSLHRTFLWLDELHEKTFLHPERVDAIKKNTIGAKGILYSNLEKFTWSVSTAWDKFPTLLIKKDKLKHFMIEMQILIESRYKEHSTQNVISYIKGKTHPDSFIVFTAHYDHLGKFGTALFPGANDNASGVAMLLNMAEEYALKQPEYSVAFIAFAGEEAGLLGSYFYTQNPLFALNKIALLINLDLMATGDKGMTVVNGSIFKDEFQNLQMLNFENGYLPAINARGKAQNSDHYYFTEAGVKSFFFYLLGDYHFYHDIDDKAESVSLIKYNEAFKLIKTFADDYMKIK